MVNAIAFHTKNWNSSDPAGIPIESYISFSRYTCFSNTKVFDIPGPGTYTYYAMAHRGLEAEGDSVFVDLHENFLVKYYPEYTVSTQEKITELSFDMWPNPASDQITIQCRDAGKPYDISIFDLQGHVISHERNMPPGSELEIASLPSGIYIVQVSTGSETGYKKLVVDNPGR